MFFPGRGESAEPARQICAQCPVRQPCLDFALSHGITHGIWGGLTERDRRALRPPGCGAARQERDEAIRAADAAGYTHGSDRPVVRPGPHDREPDPARGKTGAPAREPDRLASQTPPSREGGR